jgi:hypothetical protein
MPWEKTREKRLLDYTTVVGVSGCRSAEALANSGGRIPFSEGPLRPPEEISRLARTTVAFSWLAWEQPFWGVENLAKLETNRRATRLILAIEAYKLQHGRLPKTLDELVGPYLREIPHDPYTGEPFRYFAEGVPEPLQESLRCFPWRVPGSLIEPSAAEAQARALEVEARKPFVWSAGERVRLAGSEYRDFRRYEIRRWDGRTVWYWPQRDFDVWQAGWVFPVP